MGNVAVVAARIRVIDPPINNPQHQSGIRGIRGNKRGGKGERGREKEREKKRGRKKKKEKKSGAEGFRKNNSHKHNYG